MIQERFWGSTYIVDDESKRIMPLLCAAVDYQRMQQDYTIPYSYWTDKNGWLYIKWNVKNCESKPVLRYCFDESGKLITEAISEKLTQAELLRGKENNAPVVLITGDTHRSFNRIVRLCGCFPTTTIIIHGNEYNGYLATLYPVALFGKSAWELEYKSPRSGWYHFVKLTNSRAKRMIKFAYKAEQFFHERPHECLEGYLGKRNKYKHYPGKLRNIVYYHHQ